MKYISKYTIYFQIKTAIKNFLSSWKFIFIFSKYQNTIITIYRCNTITNIFINIIIITVIFIIIIIIIISSSSSSSSKT